MIKNKSLIITSVSLIILITAIPILYSAGSPEEKRAMLRAEEVFNSGNFLIALKRFNEFIKSFPDSESVARAKLYVADCYKKSGEMEEAISTYISISEGLFNKEEIKEAVLSLGKTRTKLAKKYLEDKLETPDIQVRAYVAEALGFIGNNGTAGKMMKTLKAEREPTIQEKLLSSIAKIKGQSIKFKSLISMFQKGGEELKINIVNILSSIKNNHVIKFFQEQLETSSGRLKPYLIRALARIDPYEYGVRLEGNIKKIGDSWQLVHYKNGKKYPLIKPGPDEPIQDREFEKFKDKRVILFGGKYQGRILYTDIYVK